MPEPDVTTTAITAGIERAITRLLSSPDLLAAIRQGVRDGVWHLGLGANAAADTPNQGGDARHAGHAD